MRLPHAIIVLSLLCLPGLSAAAGEVLAQARGFTPAVIAVPRPQQKAHLGFRVLHGQAIEVEFVRLLHRGSCYAMGRQGGQIAASGTVTGRRQAWR